MEKDYSSHALMLRDTIIDLRDYLSEVRGNDAFHDGYRDGLAHAIDMLLARCETFGLSKDLNLD